MRMLPRVISGHEMIPMMTMIMTMIMMIRVITSSTPCVVVH